MGTGCGIPGLLHRSGGAIPNVVTHCCLDGWAMSVWRKIQPQSLNTRVDLVVDGLKSGPDFLVESFDYGSILRNVRGRTDVRERTTRRNRAHVNHVEKVLDSARDRNANFDTCFMARCCTWVVDKMWMVCA